jgi:glutamate/tyrosine decarboxylase-like PLP-dependent enzyme
MSHETQPALFITQTATSLDLSVIMYLVVFSVPGVTSISADTHKYGYAHKGTAFQIYTSREKIKFHHILFTKEKKLQIPHSLKEVGSIIFI